MPSVAPTKPSIAASKPPTEAALLVPTRIDGLTANDASYDELAAHGLDFLDALDVYAGPAKYFPQPAREVTDEFGRPRRQPERILMIGPDASGRLLTVVLELPNHERICHVVTGYASANKDRTRYHRHGGRMRRS